MPSSPTGLLRVPRSGSGALVPSAARRSPAAWIALFVALIAFGLVAAPAADAADRNFAPRFSTNDTGDIDMFGNTLMTCPTSASGCTAAQNYEAGTTANSSSQNNSYNMQYIDIDGDSSTFNSSSATVSLPSGSTVLFAGLYWGARTGAGTGGSAARTAADRNKVKLKVPGGSYVSLTADQLDDGDGGIYQGFKDVTALVKTAGTGVYTAADVQASTGADTLAGWSLVIAYRNTAQPARNLSVFDGIKSIGSGQSGTIAISGFTTPPSGDVRTRVGFVNYEGDGGLVGDRATLNGTTLSDAKHPATNFFNSQSSRDGVLRAGQTPHYDNQLGVEQAIVKADNVLANGATSATIGLTSSGDVYAPGVVTFATELYAPKIDQTKTVTDVNGGLVEQGDILEYRIQGTNTGQDSAVNLVLRDPIPTNTTYVPGSLLLSVPGGATTATVGATDAAGDDRGEYDAVNRRIIARMGENSTASAGGTLAVNKTYTATFRVKVGGPTPAILSGTRIDNVATANFASASLGTPLTAESTATTTVRSPNLTIAKTGQGTIVRGQPYTYSIVVRNTGEAPTQGTVTVTDTLPTGLAFRGATPVSGTGWSCSTSGTTFTCTRSDALAAPGTYPTITLNTDVASNAPTTIANTATVSGGGDGDPSDNTDTATNDPASSADLAVEKTRNLATPAVGENVVYTLKVTNNGSSDSTGSVLTDTLPAGLVYVTSQAGCTGSAAATAVTCNVGALAAGASKSFTVTAKPAPGTAGSALTNRVSVSGNEPDPTPGNDTATSKVDVKPVDLKVTNTIQGNPTSLTAGQTYTWQVGVTNQGGSDAPNSIVHFDVPPGTTLNGPLDPRCTESGGTITCNLGTLTPGQTVGPLNIPLRIDSTNPPASVSTNATVTTTENDVDLSNNSAPTTTPVVATVDLGLVLTAPGATAPGENVTLTATVRNNGVATPQNPKVTIPLPPNTTFVSAAPGCTYDATANAVVCTLTPSDLDPGESVTKSIVVKVADTLPPGTTTISTTGRVTTTSIDTDPSNDTSAIVVPIVELAGVSITKTASATEAVPGDTVTYTLTAKNAGPAAARNVVIDDLIPAGTTFLSADAPCVNTDGRVRCEIGTLASGASRSVEVRVRVSAIAGSFDATKTHLLDVQKNETDLPIERNATGSAVASCPAGFFATDGSVRLESVDQGTGTLRNIDVRVSRATADGTGWFGSADNTATGRAQMKVTVVCLKSTTTDDGSGHVHPLLVSAPISTTLELLAGRREVVLTCAAGSVAVAPSWTFAQGGAATVRGSQREGVTGWKFTIDVAEADDATFSIRCLSTTTGEANGHVHDLGLTQKTDTVDVPANQTGSQKTTKTVTCDVDGKGIVGGSLMPDGLTSAGNDPQPISRVFGFQNTTSQDLTASVGLLCIGLRTGGEIKVLDVKNTASVSTTTPDATTTDDTASATFQARTSLTPAPRPADPTPSPRPADPTPAAPAPAAPASPAAPATPAAVRASILSSALRVTGTTSRATVSVPVRCAKACSGTASLVAAKAIKGTSFKKGAVLAKASVKLVAGKKTTLRLVATGKAAKALKRGGVKTARLVITTGKGTQVTKTVKLVLR